MIRQALILAIALPLAGAVAAPPKPISGELVTARAEQDRSEQRLAKLEAAAAAAGNEVQKAARARAAASAAIEASEARITAAEIELRARSRSLADFRRSMAEAERPLASLLAAMAMMGERPPILALADRGGVERLVRTRILLDATLPYVKSRSTALEAQVRDGERLETAAAKARAALIADRTALAERQRAFAALEDKAARAAAAVGGLALAAGDQVLAGQDRLDIAGRTGSAAARRMAAELLAEEVPLEAPDRRSPGAPLVPFAYSLPAESPVIRGMSEIDRGGVRARGITLGTARGVAIAAPASGTVRFAGPFEDYDGILLIEHEGGWISVIVNVATRLEAGTRVQRGEPVGRALGPVEVELTRNGRRFSPAIIAGSSNALFKGR